MSSRSLNSGTTSRYSFVGWFGSIDLLPRHDETFMQPIILDRIDLLVHFLQNDWLR